MKPIIERLGMEIFIDIEQLKTGDVIDDRLEALIRICDGLIFVGSSNSFMQEYCRRELHFATRLGKKVIPLLVEEVSFADIPFQIQDRKYEPLCRQPRENWETIIGTILYEQGFAVNPASLKSLKATTDLWASRIYPPYSVLERASTNEIRGLIAECSNKMSVTKTPAYHQINLALVYLHIGDKSAASEFAKQAHINAPNLAEVCYFCALVAMGLQNLADARPLRVAQIEQLILRAEALGYNLTLTNLLKWVLTKDRYLRHGMILRFGKLEHIMDNIRWGEADQYELKRLRNQFSL